MPLEHFNERNDFVEVANKRVVTSKWIDLEPDSSSIRRDCLKFYRKRISCKCLKKMHLEARKSETKMGICWHCKAERERTTLSVCSKCMIRQYCSRECQIADGRSIRAFVVSYVMMNCNIRYKKIYDIYLHYLGSSI